MTSLRDFRDRISSVKSTRKITSAMKMVAASKLKKAQEQAEASQPYAQSMSDMMARLASDVEITPESPKLLIGTGKEDVYLLLVIAADRGLCGGFNTNIIRNAVARLRDLEAENKTVKVLAVGRKVRDYFRRNYPEYVYESFVNLGGKTNSVSFATADQITQAVLDGLDGGDFDVCNVMYNEFRSVLVQKPVDQQIIPYTAAQAEEANDNVEADTSEEDQQNAEELKVPYDFEPGQQELFEQLLPKNLSVQIYRALLDSAAGEQAARMTAMDNATRNAGDMINDLTLKYNRARQAHITKELIEIISGAEAV